MRDPCVERADQAWLFASAAAAGASAGVSREAVIADALTSIALSLSVLADQAAASGIAVKGTVE